MALKKISFKKATLNNKSETFVNILYAYAKNKNNKKERRTRAFKIAQQIESVKLKADYNTCFYASFF
jgi:hypothetical protein